MTALPGSFSLVFLFLLVGHPSTTVTMGLGLCQLKSPSVAKWETTLHAERPKGKLGAVPTDSTASASTPRIPVLMEAPGKRDVCQPAPAAASPHKKEGVDRCCPSLSRSMMFEDSGNPLLAPSTRASDGRDDLEHRSASRGLGAVSTATFSHFSFQHGSDAMSHPLNCSSSAHSSNTNPFSPQGSCGGGLDSSSITDVFNTANGVPSHTRSFCGPVDACQLSSNLQPSSCWGDNDPPLELNRSLSTCPKSSLQSSGLPSTLIPCRSSVRFLGNDEKDAKQPEMGSYEVSNHGDQDRLKEASPDASTSVSIPIAQPNHQCEPQSLIEENAGEDSGPAKKKADPKLCNSVPTASSVSRETPSPWLSIEEPYSGASNHNDVFDDFSPFCFSNHSGRSSVFYGDGDGGEMQPVAALLPATSRTSQSLKSILLRPSANASGVGGFSTPYFALNSPWPDTASPGPRRVSRRQQSESERFLSEQRPSFTSVLPRCPSGSTQHRLRRGEDSSSDDEHIIASVQWAVLRLQDSDRASDRCSRTSEQQEGGLSSIEIRARALRTAARMSNAIVSVHHTPTKVEVRNSMQSSVTYESGRAGA
ncbi:hypothetical protein, unknown function [Leishmania braziliensis MHOM/BR/75/M2904]|uniref:Uncharacterized protein n=2 Tax=Leishmania braziliensis TaxID=5660 RepID=A4HJQ4_LEIBR|nr:hypothetical protein, unknown function [Leishmania braziliensis MHOM/BR/75/M2904]CAJ2478086.1 unnamed protein product [Leishmania braziliensis]CAM42720.2 hypothetical protein, unknown function [Leishmania braziliensis MHOM/BR/75/M2904]